MYYWQDNNLNDYCDQGIGVIEIDNVGSIINTGSPGNTPNSPQDRRDFSTTAYNILK
jgi:hypothetical protein